MTRGSAMVERMARTLLHPRLVMTSLALLEVYAGVSALVWDSPYIALPPAWASFAVAAGLLGLASTVWPSKGLVALSGAALVTASLLRSLLLVQAALSVADRPPGVTVSYNVAAAQWATTAYVTLVVWRRMAVPWSVIVQGDRREP